MKCIRCGEELTVKNRKEVRLAEKEYMKGLLTEDEAMKIMERAKLEVKVCFKSDNGHHVAR